jgi:hydrogenase maturation protein HypF
MHALAPAAVSPARRHVRVGGLVQGVGFRPFVYRLARELDLAGWVRNDGRGVEIEIQGAPSRLEEFLARLRAEAPPLARVDAVEARGRPVEPAGAFLIEASASGRAATAIAPDAAVCPACLGELFDPRDRRYRYAFINCTHCGPRYTITRALPYDRRQTSMARFAMCVLCAAEYGDPANRRFHAQPDACPDCGPRLSVRDARGQAVAADDALAECLRRLRAGEVVAIKGLGGYHLACDAGNAGAVARLRARKGREEKPLAIMVAGTASAARYAEIDDGERALLATRERPIVLLRKRPDCDARLPGVAPELAWLGVMLPYAPLHYLLFHEAAGRPAGTAWLDAPQPLALVMTSANPCGEPLVAGDAEALARLASIADAFLAHDRDIVARCDDSVTTSRSGRPAFVRRARGYTPQAIKLARTGPALLACGGHLKNTVCVTRGDEAFLSQHIGDLDNRATCVALEETVAHLMSVLAVAPEAVACDLHPDFFSSRFAADFAHARGLELVQVQHHHAHVAAVAAEHCLEGPLLGLALDGVGLGTDGGAWGGELIATDGARFERVAHLAPLALPGGDRAAREPWRMAASALHALGRADEIERRYAARGGRALCALLEGTRHAPPTTSAGRLFDAAAGLLEVRATSTFEGQAAMLLQGIAERHGAEAPMQGGFVIGADGNLSLVPLLARLADLRPEDAGYGAALFHATLAAALAEWVLHHARRRALARVALGGGCFLNRVLAEGVRAALEMAGLAVHEAEQAPPNDGGLSLGQALVARSQMGG